MSLLLAAALAFAEPPTSLVWDVTLNGRPVGTRTLTVSTLTTESGAERRVLESFTSLSGTVGVTSASFTQRLTAHASYGPAAFHSVVDQDGVGMEVQARLDPAGWVVSTVERRRMRTEEIPASAIDLTTADLFDPGTQVPLWTFTEVRMLTAEDGTVWTSPVERLGPSELQIGGQTVGVDGYAIQPPVGRMELYYGGSGVLVQYAWRWLGLRAVATLRDPPPRFGDDFPVDPGAVPVQEIEL